MSADDAQHEATAIENVAAAARRASRAVSILSEDERNSVLRNLADAIEQNADSLLEANAKDMNEARANNLATPKLKRLELTPDGLVQMCDGLRQIADLPDPIGKAVKDYEVPSGLRVQKIRAPLGVVAMIYESRPGVTIDAFSLCFKAGNACVLKGGREAVRSNEALAAVAHDVLADAGIPPEALTLVTTSDRDEIRKLLQQDKHIDLVIPRGGESLIRFVHEHSRIPTVQHFHGVCHIYLHADADLAKSTELCVTAKTSAPATCNAMECVLVDAAIADQAVPTLVEAFKAAGVEVRGDARTASLASNVTPATDADWGHEYLDLIVAMRVVDDVDDAIEHITVYGSNHTDVILTANTEAAARFVSAVQSSCVLVNASTRFNDGFQLGLGAEIGISTSRIHAYGPMGLEELTTQRYVVHGDGHHR